MRRDPDKVIDARGEKRVDWDSEVKSGNLTPTTGMVRKTSEPGYLHIQGQPLTEKEAQNRVVPAEVLKHVAETRRYPQPSTKSTFIGGWPDLKKKKE